MTEWLRCEECRTKEFIELVPEKPDIWYNRWPPHTWLPSRTFLLYHAPWQVHFTISIFIRLSALNCWCWWHLIWQVSPNMKISFKNSSTPAWYLSSNWRWCYCQWSRWWPRPQPRRRRWRWCIWWWWLWWRWWGTLSISFWCASDQNSRSGAGLKVATAICSHFSSCLEDFSVATAIYFHFRSCLEDFSVVAVICSHFSSCLMKDFSVFLRRLLTSHAYLLLNSHSVRSEVQLSIGSVLNCSTKLE